MSPCPLSWYMECQRNLEEIMFKFKVRAVSCGSCWPRNFSGDQDQVTCIQDQPLKGWWSWAQQSASGLNNIISSILPGISFNSTTTPARALGKCRRCFIFGADSLRYYDQNVCRVPSAVTTMERRSSKFINNRLTHKRALIQSNTFLWLNT